MQNSERDSHPKSKMTPNFEMFSGIPNYPGKVLGKIKVVKSPQDRIKRGEIAYLKGYQDPNVMLELMKVGAAICESPAITSHLATVLRELEKPSVLGVSAPLKNGDVVIVDGKRGKVFKLRDSPGT